ncbi:MAG: 50S ribosomal protein L29 [Deltaproteobacteria bacterium]|nr:50S ribosomal protein L29 [Deltaproteobacteria bacterium]
MKAADLRELKIEELKRKNKDLTEEIFNLKFQLHTGQLDSGPKIKILKKNLARVKTVACEKFGVKL